MSTELADHLRQGIERVPAQLPADLIRTAYRRYRRRRTAVAAITAAAAAIAIGAAAAAFSLSGPPSPQAQLTAYVANRVTQALNATSPDSIVFVRLTVTPPNADMPPTEVWAGSDGHWRVKSFARDGRPVTDTETYDTPSTYLIFQVDYTNRTWWRWVGPGDVTPGQPVQWTCNQGAPLTYTTSARDMTDELRTAMSCGWLKDTGTGKVDGVRAIRLTGPGTGTGGSIATTIWVNASTYLPVRITTTWPTYVVQEDTQWLPPTPANLAKLVPPTPPGFKHVPRPKGS